MLIAAGSAVGADVGVRNLPNTTMPLGSTYTITGQTFPFGGSAHATGRVILAARVNGGPWQFVAQTTTRSDGTYRVKIKPTRRGRIDLRLSTPDHRVSRVVLTVT